MVTTQTTLEFSPLAAVMTAEHLYLEERRRAMHTARSSWGYIRFLPLPEVGPKSEG